MRKNGGKLAEIAETFGIERSRVGKICTKYGLSRRHTTQYERDAILEARKQGATVNELTEMFGRSEATIDRILKTGGADGRFGRRVQGTEVEDEICRRYINGDTTISIINDLGVARKTIENIVKKHGIQRQKREHTCDDIDLDSLSPREAFPVSDTFDLDEEERNRLEEIRAAKIKNWNRLHAHKKERKAYENYD